MVDFRNDKLLKRMTPLKGQIRIRNIEFEKLKILKSIFSELEKAEYTRVSKSKIESIYRKKTILIYIKTFRNAIFGSILMCAALLFSIYTEFINTDNVINIDHDVSYDVEIGNNIEYFNNINQTPLKNGVIRVISGGGLFALPIILEAMSVASRADDTGVSVSQLGSVSLGLNGMGTEGKSYAETELSTPGTTKSKKKPQLGDTDTEAWLGSAPEDRTLQDDLGVHRPHALRMPHQLVPACLGNRETALSLCDLIRV